MWPIRRGPVERLDRDAGLLLCAVPTARCAIPTRKALIPLVFEPGFQPHGRADAAEYSLTNTSETFPDRSPDRQVRFWIEGLPG